MCQVKHARWEATLKLKPGKKASGLKPPQTASPGKALGVSTPMVQQGANDAPSQIRNDEQAGAGHAVSMCWARMAC